MEKINELFESKVSKTIDAYPSIFSKDDVVELLNNLKTTVLHTVNEMLPQPNPYLIDEEKFQDFNAAVRNKLENFLDRNNNEIIDYDSAEFNISYHNQLELENICINNDPILEELDDILLTQWQLVYGDLKTDEEI
jgi:hypothetical protein